jgi:6-phosphogluconolactonase
MKVLVGSFGPNLYTLEFDSAKGQFTKLNEQVSGTRPSWLIPSKDESLIYCVDEADNFFGTGDFEKKVGLVIVYKLEDDGKLTKVQQVLSGGGAPTHMSATSDLKHIRVANYSGGNYSTFAVDDSGLLSRVQVTDLTVGLELGPQKDRQDGSHAHWVGHSALTEGKFVYGTDLGQDKIFQYEVAGDGSLVPLNPPFIRARPNAGPRHVAFHPSQPWVYVLNELDSTLSAFSFDVQTGKLSSERQHLSTSPDSKPGMTCPSAILTDKAGKFIYTSNRDISSDKSGSNAIGVYKVEEDGTFSHVQTVSSVGLYPRHAALSPDEKWLVVGNQHSAQIDLFARDPVSGKIEWNKSFGGLDRACYIQFLSK